MPNPLKKSQTIMDYKNQLNLIERNGNSGQPKHE